jgi:hypothetical protein
MSESAEDVHFIRERIWFSMISRDVAIAQAKKVPR